MQGGNVSTNRSLKATLLLSLFVFALGAQAAHQIGTPAKAPKECGAVDVHFHQDASSHNCDLCDYEVTAEEVYTSDYSILQFPIDLSCPYFKRDTNEPYSLLTNKGPPTR